MSYITVNSVLTRVPACVSNHASRDYIEQVDYTCRYVDYISKRDAIIIAKRQNVRRYLLL